MIEQRVVDLIPGSPVEGRFLVVRKELRQGGRAGVYLDCTLCDATGRVSAKVWDKANEIAEWFQQGDVVRVKGVAETFRGELQVRIESVRPVPEDETDRANYLPRSAKDSAELERRLAEVTASLINPFLQDLVTELFKDGDFRTRFFTSPGAKSLHHAYIGGLAEHTCEVMELCLRVADVFPQLDRDLLLAAAILHDIGKIEELTWTTAFDYSDPGLLIGHIVLGEQRVLQEIAKYPDFPEELKLRLSHMLLSHHGVKEYGSPIEPMTAEAIALHHAEDLDAKVNLFLGKISEARDQGKRWTERHFLLNRSLYAGPKEEEEIKGK